MNSLKFDDLGRRRVHSALETLGGSEVRSRLISELASPMELHQFVLHYNWDDGEQAIIDILNHPLMDYGTALFIYWASTSIHLQYSRVAWLKPHCEEALKLYDRLQQTEVELLGHAYRSELIRVDPKNDLDGFDWTTSSIPFVKTPRDELYGPSNGVDVKRDDLEYVLTNEEVSQREAEFIRQRYENLLEKTRYDRALLDNALAYHKKYYPDEPFKPPPPAPELLWTDEERRAHEEAENREMFELMMRGAQKNPEYLDNAKAFHQKYFPNEVFPNLPSE